MGKHLVLVADSSNARIMEKNSMGLELIGEAYERTGADNFDKGSSKPGRIKKVMSGTHSFAPHSDIHRVEKEHFIRDVANQLNNGLSVDLESLVLIAPPQTLGELRKFLGQNVLSKVDHEISKDLTKLKTAELMRYVTKPYH
jgi:protein required for attachment to host cells